MALTPGLHGEADTIVTRQNIASAMGSGGVDVFSTPMMIALMEKAATNAVQPHLNAGESTVGTVVNIRHIAATPMGMKVRAVAHLEAVEGKRLVYRVEAFDEKELIGDGVHERYVIHLERFLYRVAGKGLS